METAGKKLRYGKGGKYWEREQETVFVCERIKVFYDYTIFSPLFAIF